MTTTKAYDDLVELLLSGGRSKSQARRVATQMGEREGSITVGSFKPTGPTIGEVLAHVPKRKSGWPKGKKRGPKAGK